MVKHKVLTGKIIEAAYEVHNYLGCGFQEVIYQRALSYEMAMMNLDFAREQEQEIMYKECVKPIGTRRADFVVEEVVLVELKAISQLETVHWAQILNYLKAYNLDVGLLINFGNTKIQIKRFVM